MPLRPPERPLPRTPRGPRNRLPTALSPSERPPPRTPMVPPDHCRPPTAMRPSEGPPTTTTTPTSSTAPCGPTSLGPTESSPETTPKSPTTLCDPTQALFTALRLPPMIPRSPGSSCHPPDAPCPLKRPTPSPGDPCHRESPPPPALGAAEEALALTGHWARRQTCFPPPRESGGVTARHEAQERQDHRMIHESPCTGRGLKTRRGHAPPSQWD